MDLWIKLLRSSYWHQGRSLTLPSNFCSSPLQTFRESCRLMIFRGHHICRLALLRWQTIIFFSKFRYLFQNWFLQSHYLDTIKNFFFKWTYCNKQYLCNGITYSTIISFNVIQHLPSTIWWLLLFLPLYYWYIKYIKLHFDFDFYG